MKPMMMFVAKHFRQTPLVGAEVGVFRGIHSASILREMPQVKKLYLVDPYKKYWTWRKGFQKWLPAAKETAKKRMKRFNPSRYEWIYKPFEANIIPEPLDFVYIDANHSYEAVLHDIKESEKRLKHGGVIGGHDYHEAGQLEERFGVGRAVREHYAGTQIHVKDKDWWVIL